MNKEELDKAIEELIQEVLNHESIQACDAAIGLQALRTSTKGYEGEKLNDVLERVLKKLLQVQTQDIKKRITKKEELHTHNSIPSFTGDLENWCVICIRNQAIEDILKMLDE